MDEQPSELKCQRKDCNGRLHFIAVTDPVEWAKPRIPARAMYMCDVCRVPVFYVIPDADLD